jgi:hypothetical protein
VRLNAIAPFVFEMLPENDDGSIVRPGTFGFVHGVLAPVAAVRFQFFESVTSSFMFRVNEPLSNPMTAAADTAPLASTVA